MRDARLQAKANNHHREHRKQDWMLCSTMPPCQSTGTLWHKTQLAHKSTSTILATACNAARPLLSSDTQSAAASPAKLKPRPASQAATLALAASGLLICPAACAQQEPHPWWVDPAAQPSAALLFFGVACLAVYSTWDLCVHYSKIFPCLSSTRLISGALSRSASVSHILKCCCLKQAATRNAAAAR